MALNASTTTTLSDLLRRVYMPNMRRQFNLKSIMLQTFGRTTKNVPEGEHLSVPLYGATGSGYVWSDAGEFNDASVESVKRATFNYAYALDRIILTEDLMDRTASNKAAETSALDFHINALVSRNRHDLNFDLINGDGSGKLAGIASASSSTQFTVDSVRGLRNNMRIDVLLTASGAPSTGGVSNVKITFNRSTKVVTLQGGATLDNTDLNANAANYSVFRAKSFNQAPFGLAAIINDANPTISGTPRYGGIDRSDDDFDFYRAKVHDFANSAPDFATMQEIIDAVSDNSDGSTNMILVGNKIWSHLVERLEGDKRYGGKQMRLNGWAQAVDFAGIPIVKDKHCNDTDMWFLDTTMFSIHQRDEGRWMDDDGAILSRLENRAAYQAGWTRRMQLICWAPAAQAHGKNVLIS